MVPPQPNLRRQPVRIVVVEDEVLIRLLVANELREAGFVVIEATCADDALSYFQAGGQVDLVLSDIRLPGSLSGVDLARLLRKDLPSLPIILTSGNPGTEYMNDVTLFVPKPYKVEHVVALVFSTLGLQKPEDPT
jgi:CheY-like chemotaxis protein